MKTPAFLLRSVGTVSFALAPLSLLAAACNGALTATIHRALSEHTLEPGLLTAFAGFSAGRIAAAYLSTVVLGDRAARSVSKLRDHIVTRILSVPYRQVERIGSARILAALTHDVLELDLALSAVPGAVTSFAMLLGGAAYLLYLSPLLFGALSLLVFTCLIIFRAFTLRADASYVDRRRTLDRLWAHFASVTQGTKELKLNAARRASFLQGPMHETTTALLRHNTIVRSRYAISSAVNAALILFVLGVVLFLVPHGSVLRMQIASGYVLVGLYLISPLASLARLWPLFTSAEVALRSLDELGLRLANTDDEPSAPPSQRSAASCIELVSVTYGYDGERKFVLGPVSQRICAGEVVFIVGGNGSGKTTLGRLLTGLYAPDGGELLWDGRRVTAQNIDLYRQLWSAVFSDVHLFDQTYGLEYEQQRAAELISHLGLEGTVRVDDKGAFSTLELSQGQRKRLGLLVALLEDRPFYIFDEWAADQDPQWKNRFYRELLPELRARGKCVVAITHDDRFFDAADRLIVLHDGQVDA